MTSDSVVAEKERRTVLLSKYTEEQIANPTEEQKIDMSMMYASYIIDAMYKKSVWFMINEQYGRYRIIMYYDNEYNHSDGEDL